MRFLYTALAALAISTGVFGSVMADDITADVLTYDGNTKVVNAKGDVVIHANQGATITASQNTTLKTEVPTWKGAFTM